MQDNTSFYLSHQESLQSCFLALRDIILRHDETIKETTKYGMPCFCINNKALCYLWKDKKSNDPYILFVEGNKIDHPSLETGNRARMKILMVDPSKDIPADLINEVLSIAITYCKA